MSPTRFTEKHVDGILRIFSTITKEVNILSEGQRRYKYLCDKTLLQAKYNDYYVKNLQASDTHAQLSGSDHDHNKCSFDCLRNKIFTFSICALYHTPFLIIFFSYRR